MPFKSQAQRRWMFWKMPSKAREWAAETPDIKKLPEHVHKKQKGKI